MSIFPHHKGLKQKLVLSNLSLAAIGIVLLVVCLITFIWLNRGVDRLFQIDIPLTQAIENTREQVLSSTASLRGWVAIKDKNFVIKRAKQWNKGIYPNLDKIIQLTADYNNPKLTQLLAPLKSTLLDLNAWQWNIEQVAHTKGNYPAKDFLKTRVLPVANNTISLISILVQEAKNQSNPNNELIYKSTNFRGLFNSSKSELVAYIMSNNAIELENSRNLLRQAKLALSVINENTPSASPQEQSIIKQINQKFNYYILLIDQLAEEQQNKSNNIAQLWMSAHAIPISNSLDKLLDQMMKITQSETQLKSTALENTVDIILYVIILSIIILIISSISLALFNANHILRPILLLLSATKAMASGQLNKDIPINQKDEIAELTDSFNQMRAQRQLSENKITAIIETAIDPIITINEHGIIQTCNTATTRLLHYNKDELIGSNIAMIMPEPHHSQHDKYIQNYLKTGLKKIIGISRELTVLAKNGIKTPVLLSVSEINLGSERIFTGIIRDLTEIKDREQQRQALENQLQHVQKLESIGQLAGGIAHDFNNILNAVSGYATLQHQQLIDTGASSDTIKKINSSVKRASILTNKLLNFAHKSQPDLRLININEILTEAVELLQQTLPGSISLNLNTIDEDVFITADSTQLMQVFLNLAINARNAMPNGGDITITSQVTVISQNEKPIHPHLHAGNYSVISIQDTGKGMAPEIIEKIFEPFFTTHKLGEGTGLGLSIVYGILNEHDATILVNSTPGKGTTFTLYFPLKQHPQVNPQSPNETTTAATDIVQLKDKTILIVDDEEMLRELLFEFFKPYNCHLLLAEDGKQAIDIMQHHQQPINLIIMDVQMPHLDGYASYQQIQTNNPGTKVIFTSGYTDEEMPQALKQNSNVSFMAKPYQLDELLATAIQMIST
ncbi:MAG: PAS domain S-box protein [Coxiellaceae bacterium]|nr:PAS domain S-box protein [Coxiellaceae bacterium]